MMENAHKDAWRTAVYIFFLALFVKTKINLSTFCHLDAKNKQDYFKLRPYALFFGVEAELMR